MEKIEDVFGTTVPATDRILRMKTDGASLREIAAMLGVGYGTIRTRLKAVS